MKYNRMKCDVCFHQMRINPFWTGKNKVREKYICLDCGNTRSV